MRLIADMNQLNVDANLMAGALYAAFEHIFYIEYAANLRNGLAGDNPRGGRGNHAEMRRIELADSCACIFREAESDVVRLGIAAHVSEREDRDEDFFLRRVDGPKPTVDAKREST